MKIQIIGNGVFGKFLTELLKPYCEITSAKTKILAVPYHAYYDMGRGYTNDHLVNVCSIQQPTFSALWHSGARNITCIHPLFGPNTPADKRNSVVTYGSNTDEEKEFIDVFSKVSKIRLLIGPENHDKLMKKTHWVALDVAEYAKRMMSNQDIPDYLVPNSYRLLKNFVDTVQDMPAGTKDSIRSNPF